MAMPTYSDEQYVHAYQYSKGSPQVSAIDLRYMLSLCTFSYHHRLLALGSTLAPATTSIFRTTFFDESTARHQNLKERTNTDFLDLILRFFVEMSQTILQATLPEYYFPDIVAAHQE